MQTLTKFCRKSESSISFSYESAVSVTEVANLRPIKAVRRDAANVFFHERLSEFCLKSNTHRLLIDRNTHA